MSTRSIDYLDAIKHLPGGALLTLYDVSWDEYEEVLRDLSERRHFRLSYDCGKLQIVSPSRKHETYATFVGQCVCLFSLEFGLAIENYGSTTWRKKSLKRGAEADVCSYVANARRVIGKSDIDLQCDPPPDIVVEVDITNEARRKFPIYASLLVPEIWRYDGQAVQSYELSQNDYREIPESRFVPTLKPDMLAAAFEETKTIGQTEALLRFRDRLQQIRGEA
jgi:Uma2 family endonuclease